MNPVDGKLYPMLRFQSSPTWKLSYVEPTGKDGGIELHFIDGPTGQQHVVTVQNHDLMTAPAEIDGQEVGE